MKVPTRRVVYRSVGQHRYLFNISRLSKRINVTFTLIVVLGLVSSRHLVPDEEGGISIGTTLPRNP